MLAVVGYYRHHRQWRGMNELASLFDGCEGMIVHSPFVHRYHTTTMILILSLIKI
jgi:hypothetical protein